MRASRISPVNFSGPRVLGTCASTASTNTKPLLHFLFDCRFACGLLRKKPGERSESKASADRFQLCHHSIAQNSNLYRYHLRRHLRIELKHLVSCRFAAVYVDHLHASSPCNSSPVTLDIAPFKLFCPRKAFRRGGRLSQRHNQIVFVVACSQRRQQRLTARLIRISKRHVMAGLSIW